MDLNTRKILSLFASILFTIPVYIILHEGGNALIALSCGARITEFWAPICAMKAVRSPL